MTFTHYPRAPKESDQIQTDNLYNVLLFFELQERTSLPDNFFFVVAQGAGDFRVERRRETEGVRVGGVVRTG